MVCKPGEMIEEDPDEILGHDAIRIFSVRCDATDKVRTATLLYRVDQSLSLLTWHRFPPKEARD